MNIELHRISDNFVLTTLQFMSTSKMCQLKSKSKSNMKIRKEKMFHNLIYSSARATI